ncbi:MAG: FtsX-like permease family protein [Cytophagales bacterium]|nr:FtsX-like permease family protein [Cytophagales bacterium]
MVILKNYLMTFLRQIKKNQLTTFLNVAGLLIGLTSSLFLLYYSFYERSFDRFHKDKSQVYRVIADNYKNGALTLSVACSPAPIGPAIQDEIPEVINYSNIGKIVQATIRHEDKVIFDDNMIYSDASLFELFSFEFLNGSDTSALGKPNTIFLSESMSKRIFGDEDPMNKVIVVSDKFSSNKNYEVKGIFYDLPGNTYFNFSAVASFENQLDQMRLRNNWWPHFTHTYVKVNETAVKSEVERKINDTALKYLSATFEKRNMVYKYSLQPIEDMYLYSDLLYEFGKNGDGDTVRNMFGVVILILIITFINFLNIQASQILGRVKEVVVRKSLGANRSLLARQIIFENTMIVLPIVAFSVLLFLLLRAPINNVLGSEIYFTAEFFIAAFLIVLVFSIFPALFLTGIVQSIKPALFLKGRGNMVNERKIKPLKNIFLVFQFAATFYLLIYAISVNQQITYSSERDLGIDIENTLVINKPPQTSRSDSSFNRRYNTFFDKLKSQPGISHLAYSSRLPGEDIPNRRRYRKSGEDESKQQYLSTLDIDQNYIFNYNHKVIAGEVLPNLNLATSKKIVLNERGVELLNFASPEAAVGRRLLVKNDEIEIIAVIENYHQQSVKVDFIPTAFMLSKTPQQNLSFKYNEADFEYLVGEIASIWNRLLPNFPFEYRVLSDQYALQYSNEFLLKYLIFSLSIIFIVMTFLGISGILFTDMINRRNEIGLRKILGSTLSLLILAYVRRYLKLVLASILIAIPGSYFFVRNWLETYAFRIDFPWILMYIPTFFLLAMVVIVVSLYVNKVSNTNPEKAVRA